MVLKFCGTPYKSEKIVGQNIGMWGVYPEVLDWKVGAVQAEFWLDLKKKPKNL